MQRTYPYVIDTASTNVNGMIVIFEEVISRATYRDRETEHFQYRCKTESGSVLYVYPDNPFPVTETFRGTGFESWKNVIKTKLSSGGAL